MNSEYAVVAAYAAGEEPPPQAFMGRSHPNASAPHQARRGQHTSQGQLDGEDLGEFVVNEQLPVVDDLEVAAAAAAAAMEALDDEPSSTDSDESSDDSDADDSMGDHGESGASSGSGSGSDSDAATMEVEPAAVSAELASEEPTSVGPPLTLSGGQQQPREQSNAGNFSGVRVKLRIEGDAEVALELLLADSTGGEAPMHAAGAQQAQQVDDLAVQQEAPGGSGLHLGLVEHEEEEEESEDESSDDSDEEITDLAQIREIINAFDEDDEDGAGGDSSAHRAEQELLGGAPLAPVEVELHPDEKLSAAGSVQAVLEGMIVVKAVPGGRALGEGSLLVLEDKGVVGRVEEVFGPVASPLYALRYAGPQPMPADVAPGCALFSVDRLSEFVLPEVLQQQRGDAEVGEEGEDPELQFSDDEAEAEYKRKMKAKRKGIPEGGATGPPQRQQGGRGGGRGPRGRGRGGRGGGRGGAPPVPSPPQGPPQVYYHPHQQQVPPGGGGPGGRLFRGNPAVPALPFQTTATAGQLAGMSLQAPAPGGPPPAHLHAYPPRGPGSYPAASHQPLPGGHGPGAGYPSAPSGAVPHQQYGYGYGGYLPVHQGQYNGQYMQQQQQHYMALPARPPPQHPAPTPQQLQQQYSRQHQ